MSQISTGLVNELKKRNPEIGDYVSTIINVDLNHLIRFSNRAIEVPKYFFEEFQSCRNSISEEQFIDLARRFEKFD